MSVKNSNERRALLFSAMVVLNKSVCLDGGDTLLCEYDTESLKLSPLWISISVISLVLNLFAAIGNILVIAACCMQKRKPSLIIYIQALAVSDLLYSLAAPFYTYRYVMKNTIHCYMFSHTINISDNSTSWEKRIFF